MNCHLFNQINNTGDINLEQLRLVAALSEHVVLAVQQTFKASGARKKELAVQVLIDLLRDCSLPAYPSLIDVAIESSVKVMNIFEKSAQTRT